MFRLGKHGPDGRYGVIVDVGSGSVGIAIAASDPYQDLPLLIWSYRERAALKAEADSEVAQKDILTALVNSFLTLGSLGFKALREYDARASIDTVQVAISAPWSYTITKTVSSQSDTPFVITKSLVAELIASAEKAALELINTDHLMDKLGLEVMARATIDIRANDYIIHQPFGKTVQRVAVTQLSAVSQKKVMDVSRELCEKVVPKAKLNPSTFMYNYYQALNLLHPDTSEICLMDITAEATELGIVRDGILKYVTHMPYGMYTIARQIVTICTIPHEEALGYIKDNQTDLLQSLTPAKKEQVLNVIANYENELADLFKRTGDELSIPKTVFVHTDQLTENFFKERLDQVANKTRKSDHTIHFITSKLFETVPTNDSAILLSAFVFHKNLTKTSFT